MSKYTIAIDDYHGIYEHKSLFASSFGKGENKGLYAVMSHNFDNDETIFFYRVTVKDVAIFEDTSFVKAIEKYNKI